MFRSTRNRTPADRPVIDPTAEILHLTSVAALFNLKPATIRQAVSRGTMPTPTVRRSPELGWDPHDIYAWAYEQGLMPLAAVPFRHLRHVIDHTETRGAPVPRVHSVTSITQGLRRDSGVQVYYGGLTDENLGFTLYYPHEQGQLLPTPGEAGVTIRVTGHLHPRGFFVDVHQAHPDYDYATDTEAFTQDVAELVGEAIPYWPMGLRSTAVGVDRTTGHVAVTRETLAQPPRWDIARGMAVETFAASPQGEARPGLVKAMRAAVDSDYHHAAREADHYISEYVSRHQTHSWALTDPKHHLVLATTMPDVPDPDDDWLDAYAQLETLAWHEPVGDSPITRQLAPDCARALSQRTFSMANPTAAERAFTASLTRVDEGDATLAHLAFSHPSGTPSSAMTVSPTFWRDHASGALVTIYAETESSPAYCCYAVPQELLQPLEVQSFDFTDDSNPFVWAVNGAAIPYPDHPDSGYSLGYRGTGPAAIMETTARLLDVPELDHHNLPPTWPFYSPGYPTTVPAEEMRAFFHQTTGLVR